MKIDGRDNFEKKVTVEVMPGLNITINSLPFGFQDEMAKELPSPVPPEKKAINPDTGKPITELRNGMNILKMIPDENDPKFKRAEAEQTRRQAVYMIYHGTQHDEKLAWESNPDAYTSKELFYDAIYAEMKEARIPYGAMNRLASLILALSGADTDQLETVEKAVFLAQTESEANGAPLNT